jgi:hypothetical protein
VSSKNSLKDKIKKPNATQTFFNSYEKVEDKKEQNIEDEVKNVNDVQIEKDVTDVNETYDMDDNVVDDNNDEDDDYLRKLASGTKVKKQKKKKVFTSFYMDPDLAIEVDSIASRGEKGDKSKLINKAIRSLLEQYGVIEKR